MKVMVKVYDTIKYDPNSKKVSEKEFDIISFKVRMLRDEDVIAMGIGEVDPCGEYLFLTLTGGGIAIFNNNLCDMFKV